MASEQFRTSPDANRSLLRALCVASFLNTGLCMVLYGIGLLSMLMIASMPYADYEALFQQQMKDFFDAGMLGRTDELLHIIHGSGVALLAILFARTLVRFMGVMLMWRGRILGFHIYAFAQLAGIFAPHLVLPWSYLGFFGPLMAIGMTAVYGSQRRSLN